ncbi:MAG TPA: DUF4468 domain-containing protein [Geobacteraceae bacterium]|nr:DUF4468 domain-containing protein [Geobacteraceae bacterium]
MKRILIIFVLLLAGCAAYSPMPPGEMTILTKMEAPGLSKQEIFDKSEIWMERHLFSRGKIIREADMGTGVIVANGYINYPAEGKLEAIHRIQYTITFDMKVKVADSAVTVAFSDLLLDIPRNYLVYGRWWPLQEYSGGYSEPIEDRADFDAAKRGLLEVAEKLGGCLKLNRCE